MYNAEAKRVYYLLNKDIILKQRKEHYKVNAVKIKQNVRDYYKAVRKNKLKENPEKQTWYDMLNRCKNYRHAGYSYYGGRGIQVKYKDYEDFISDVGLRPSAKYSIDRINNNGNYEPGNCRWATWSQQMKNRRRG